MWAERERPIFRSPLKPTFVTPALRSDPAHAIFRPLRSRSAPITCSKTFYSSVFTVGIGLMVERNKKAVLSQRWPRDARYLSISWDVAEIWPFEIIQDGGGRHLEFIRIENSATRSAVPEKPTYNQTWSGSNDRLRRYGHLNLFQDGGGRHLGFVRTGNSAMPLDPPSLKTPL